MIVLYGEIEKQYRDKEDNDKIYVKCQLLADDKPATMPVTGDGIKGLKSIYYLAPGTCMITKAFEVCMLGAEGWGNWQ